MQISDGHLEHLRRDGFVLVPGFLTSEELAGARRHMLRYVPTAEELAATPERYPWVFEEAERLQTEFPFSNGPLNSIATHPDLIEFAERALDTRDILLSQSAIWAKYAGTGDFEQSLHLDYEGNTLVVPRDDGDYRQINMILYYSDVTEEMGPTCVVAIQETADLPVWPTFRARKGNSNFYKREKKILAKAGDLFIFGMRTWHRASAMKAGEGVRLSHHMIWRGGRHAFQGFHQWSQMGEKAELKRFIEFSAPRQREVLGFPPAGDRYWNAETITAVKLRYPQMDIRIYSEKCQQGTGSKAGGLKNRRHK